MGEAISVVIPAHPARERSGLLARALASVEAQALPPLDVIVERDAQREGAARTRQRGLERVSTDTDWVAFLDSDDEMLPHHLQRLSATAQATGADYVYSHYQVIGGSDPRPWSLGRPFDPATPHQTTITVLVRTALAQRVGFLRGDVTPEGLRRPGRLYGGEDWEFTLGCVQAGARIVHLPEVTWRWHHHGRNSSGLPERGDAR